jgi:hypothetical protein
MIATTSNPNVFKQIKKPSDFFSFDFTNNKLLNYSTKKGVKFEKGFVEVEFENIDYKTTLEIVDIKQSKDKVDLYLKLGNGVFLILSNLKTNGIYYDVAIDYKDTNQTQTSSFITNTYLILLSLSKKVKVTSKDFSIIFGFELSLKDITTLLQYRQMYRKLMIIEETFNISFGKVSNGTDEDVENISYCYKSIVERKFEVTSKLPKQFYSSNAEIREIFGNKIDLGIQQIKVSRYGVAEIESITTPKLPKNAFSKDIQKLIDLDEKLDSMAMDKYFDLAGATLDGLTEEQIEAITERPRLDEEVINF